MNRLAVAFVVLWSCGGPKQPQPITASQAWSAPQIFAHVPADTPYVIGGFEPVGDRVRRHLLAGVEQQLQQALRATDGMATGDRSKLDPWLRSALAVLDQLRGKPAGQWAHELGFAREGRWVLYGLGVWPVLRIELDDAVKLRGVIDRAIAVGGAQVSTVTRDGRSYWRMRAGPVELIAVVLDRELVIAALPARAVDGALGNVLATRPPERSLASTRVLPDLLARHHFLGAALGYIDIRALVNVLTRDPTELDVLIRDATGPVTGACKSDLERLARAVPRVAYGYRRLDEHAFDLAIVAETHAGRALVTDSPGVPGVTTTLDHQPLVAFGVAHADAVFAWMADLGSAIKAQPFRCTWLEPLEEVGSWLATAGGGANRPAFLQGMQGFSVVVDDVDMAPPSGAGHLLVVGDHAYDLLQLVNATLPVFAGGLPPPDGTPVAVSLAQLGIPWLDSLHVAAKPDRLAIAIGPDSERQVTDQLAALPPAHSPLLVFAFDAPRLQKLLDAINPGSADRQTLRDLGKVVMRVDADADAITVGMAGTWATSGR